MFEEKVQLFILRLSMLYSFSHKPEGKSTKPRASLLIWRECMWSALLPCNFLAFCDLMLIYYAAD